MSVKIRLQRKGRKKKPFYHIVIADSRAPRDGRFIEKIGTYNPLTKPATIEIDRDKAYNWLLNGAQPTETVRAILRFKGVYYRKHLMRGVQKGVMTPEEAEAKYQEWVATKEAKIAARFAKTAEEKAAFRAMVAGANITVAAPALEAAGAVSLDVQAKEEAQEAPVDGAVTSDEPVTAESTADNADEAPSNVEDVNA